MVKTIQVPIVVELEEALKHTALMLMEERGSSAYSVKVAAQLIFWDLLPTVVESLDLMEDMVEEISVSTAVMFGEYTEGLAPGSIPSASIAVVHNICNNICLY